jgi:hypothetical protein
MPAGNERNEKTCEQLVEAECDSTIEVLRDLWELYCKDSDAYHDVHSTNLYEYGLSFDYVPLDTFHDQEEGYFRYQISWGGPSDEFRFFTGPDFVPYRIEYWYMDWFDGARRTLRGPDLELLKDIFQWFDDMGCTRGEFDQSREG